ncbi:UPF0158 family protein [Chondrinema litorale]|uniref:UPF0158 family protein n=1 Tax=Chondrinema litorale TaxID=2994555 RepID=UPI0025431781|nr:UPF0158 family protein [Chondrinema litorale]UZR95842.1 hypothetical protein OQ292_08450 [Chondrinema litorale]
MKKTRKDLIKKVQDAYEVGGFKYYLEKNTWEVLSYPDDENVVFSDLDLYEDVLSKLQANVESYVEIPLPSSSEVFIIMEDFTDTIHNLFQQDMLMRAINGPKPYKQFRFALEDTGLLKDWHQFRDNAYKKIADQWVDEFLERYEQKVS